MKQQLSVVWFVLFLWCITAAADYAQEPKLPQKVETSVGIYDVQSSDDIHQFSASEIRELVRMENSRFQGQGTIPHPILVHCFEERIFRYTGGKYQDAEIKYRLHTPKTIRKGRKYPLIVHLHGVGESGADNISSLVHLHSILPLMIGSEREDFFMLVTQCPPETQSWNFQTTKDGTLDVLAAIMEHVIAEHPIDRKRITATGVSSGGRGVWELLLKYPDLFAGAVPTACGAPHQPQKLTALKQTPIWAIINKGDIDPGSILKAMQVINDAGGSMALTEADTPDHNAWRPAMEDYNCVRWMLAQKKGSWFSPPPGTIIHNRPYLPLFVFFMYILPISIIVFLLWKISVNRRQRNPSRDK